ncbi:MAG: tRNA pseudouridine(55) synthase TruB [Pirellula sp.]
MYGVLNLNKPVGPTSRACVNAVNKLLPGIKVAHAGTLDPLASGVLLILIGPAVRLMDDVHDLEKEYVGCFQLGASSPSGDLETELSRVPIPEGLTAADFHQVIPGFLGEIEQQPPAYSAIRIEGQRAHERARSGKVVDMPLRRVRIHALELIAFQSDRFSIRVRCSTGTYLRTLGMDIARALGTEAVMTDLVRTRIGPFALEDAVPMENLSTESIVNAIQPASAATAHLPAHTVSNPMMRRILDGQRLDAESLFEQLSPAGDRVAVLDHRGVLRAIVEKKDDGRWRCEKGIAHWDVLPDV